MSDAQREADEIEYLRLLEEEAAYQERTRLYRLFPDTGRLRRDLYPKHLEFFAAGGEHQERAFIAANRVGKSMAVCYELSCHLTGWYPPWWVGYRFDRPITAWAAGEDTKAVRESLQETLLGRPGSFGTGLVPGDLLKSTAARSGVPEAIDTATVVHVDGALSRLVFKCHPAGQRVWMANGRWLPIEVVEEGDLLRCADGEVRVAAQKHVYQDAPVWRVTTPSGVLEGTPNHPVFTDRGKLRIDQLVVGDVLEIATPPVGIVYGDIPEWVVGMTALMIGDGCCRSKTPLFTCAHPPTLEAVRDLLPPDLKVVKQGKLRPFDYKVSSSLHKRNRLKEVLEWSGLWGMLAEHKFVPPWVFSLTEAHRRLFLRWLWSCDGTVNGRMARYTSSSLSLVRGVQELLWGMGMYAHLASPGPRHHYAIVTGEDRRRFGEIGRIGRDEPWTAGRARIKEKGRVTKIESIGNSAVYGIGVPDVHELIVEGFRVGNTYDQGRESFQASKVDVVVFDEEPPIDIYTEGLTRVMSTVPGQRSGIVMCAFTPLRGLSEVVLSYMPGGERKEGALS